MRHCFEVFGLRWKRNKWFILLGFCMLLFTACGKKPEKLSAGVFLKISTAPVGDVVEDYERFQINLEVYQDGRVDCYADGFEKWLGDDLCPTKTLHFSSEEIARIQEIITQEDFLHMRNNVGNRDIKEGERKVITIYTTQGEHVSGGIAISNRSFLKLYDYVQELARDSLFAYKNEVTEIQRKGAKRESKKGIHITDMQEKDLVGRNEIEKISLTYGDDHKPVPQTKLDGEYVYYVTLTLTEDGAKTMAGKTKSCTADNPIYYKVFENENYLYTFGVEASIEQEMHIYETTDLDEARERLEQYQSSIFDW